ncbi:hypothetical protein EDE15_0884 [Edaphobacter aggregans]|uniref:Uncharacterized protein n=1 Tax=Edaphobacter aggregans TaxID=570835 RepID=A0A3R9QFJ0_9BACT|nr:hypothetical protein [Edaphobacter aggregans]RSL15398.1 hypothetical protein EDE15_0884 [Edaphobacter aggregans]
MTKHNISQGLTRRDLLRLSTAGATALGAKLAFPEWVSAAVEQNGTPQTATTLYAQLLQTWCDGLLEHQVTEIQNPALHGALLCPACALIHGRCGDAVYPLLRVAHTTGNAKYLNAALLVHEWSERQVSRADGSWINDVTLSSWKGITVFHAISLAEALRHHSALLDTATHQRWTNRLARAAKFLDTFISIETGNINYPVTSSFCFALCGQVLGNDHYLDRARQLAHTTLDYFTPNNFLYGEGHPLKGLTAKHCHPVDLGYNVEESLPSLAQYALLTNDKLVLDQTIAALRTHMEFMLPDGAWDNSWGTRNYKWSWWGSRTSDGCHPAYVLLAPHEPKFREVAYRNLEFMAACTHNNLLYGGSDYFAHGDLPCIHHTFTHAKALATVLDSGADDLVPAPRLTLPRDEPYGVKTYPEIGTHLAAIGPWRATVTDYDWEYVEHVQSGSGASGGGHVSGGTLSLLFHRQLGPILTASMTEYQMIEISNQQTFGDYPHMSLAPRIELISDKTYTSTTDFAATLTSTSTPAKITFDASGRLLTAAHQPPSTGDLHYHLTYRLNDTAIEIEATADAAVPLPAPLRFILPVISRSTESINQTDPKTIRIAKPGGTLIVRTDAPHGFELIPNERTFNLVPGFECAPLTIAMQPSKPIRIQMESQLP